MPVTASILITQFETQDTGASVSEVVLSVSNSSEVRESKDTLTSSSLQTHLPAVTQPTVTTASNSWPTPIPAIDHWSDSPTNAPELLYRRRFSWGRDEKEVFPQPAKPGHLYIPAVTSPGIQWGNLDTASGLLLYQRFFSLSSSVTSLEFRLKGQVGIRDVLLSSTSSFSTHELGEVTGEATVQEKLFIFNALPIPGSVKNPTTTDIYIRLGNLTHPIDPDSFILYVDNILQPTLTVSEFFTGLGGYDVTWSNTSTFEYSAQVDVRWEFSDLDSPATPFLVNYPFYIVDDTTGPRVTNLTPADLVENVPVDTSIRFQVEDIESGVNIDSLVLYVNNIKVLNSSLTATELLNEKGYSITYLVESDLLFGDLIPVSIFISDNSKDANETFYSYSFTTISSESPRLINLRPLVCSVDIPVQSSIGVDVIDGGHGINKDSIVFTVENVDKSGHILIIPIVHRDK